MAIEVETLLVKLEARITDFEKNMARAEKRADSAAKRIQRSFTAVPGALSKALGAIGAGLSARAFVGLIKDGIETGQVIGDLSEKLGISAERLQELTFVAEQNGAAQDDLAAGFRGLTKFLGEASTGTDKAVNLLKQLGLTFDQLRSKQPADIFELLLDRIGKIGNPLQRNATLMQVFGKAGTQLAQVAALGASRIDELRQQAQSAGLVLSNDTVKALQDAGDQLDKLNRLWLVGKAAIAREFIPVLDELVTFLTSETFQSAFHDFLSTIKAEIETDIRDFNGIINLAKGVLANLKSAALGGLSSSDQPLPPVPGRNSDASDAAIANSGKLKARFVDIFGSADAASGATRKLTSQTLEASGSFQKAQRAALGLTDQYETLGGVTDDQAKAQRKAESAAEAAAKKLDDENKQLQFEGEQLGRTARDQAIYNALNEAGTTISTAAGRAIAIQAAQNFDLSESIRHATERMDLFRDSARTGLSTFISDLRQGKSALESLGDVLDQITSKLIDFGVDQLVNGLLGEQGSTGGGFLSGLISGRRSGGSVSRGQPVVVGEDGPEIFVPRTSGIVGRGGQGGQLVVEQHIHNNANVSVRQEQKRTDSGLRMDVTIDEVVAGKMRDPSSRISKALTSRGASVQPIRR